ncbi:MAG: DNA polymerase III subunit alpha [Candidatus Omnitrophica bacterium]|nr:DNA polymerase III subunit alpha [Candidatus Omnitrophota bacterium]
MNHSKFVHLHVHSQYSLLDGACHISRLVQVAKRLNMPAIAITDHGNMFGAIEFYDEAMKNGIKPIIGCEVYVAPRSRFDRGMEGMREGYYHLVLLARDEAGYQNLVKIVSTGYLEGFYYKPRIDKEYLAEHAEGLVCLSACLKGEVARLLSSGDVKGAEGISARFREIFGNDNFYIEIQDHGLEEQKRLNPVIVRLAHKMGIPLVATNDAHYLTQDMAEAHDALLCIGTQTTLDNPNRLRYQTDQFYLKSEAEMRELFKEIPEALSNTIAITERCNLELDFTQVHLPKYQAPDGMERGEYLRHLCEEGLLRRYPDATPEIRQRLDHELSIITQLGYTSYFLIAWDFIHFAKEHQVPVGPGRGSAAGCLVSYLLGITDIDPLRYGLLFERFLNPDRVSLPDIDIDFCYERRNEVINYVIEKYSKERVAQIITFGTMMAKGVIRDVGRVMNMPYIEVDRIAKLVPHDPAITIAEAMRIEPRLKDMYDTDPQIKKLLDISGALEGLTRHASTHAAGVVISEKPLSEIVPLFRGSDNQVSTGFSMKSLEKIGMLKIDFLGLRTLTVIDEAVKIIKRSKGIDLDLNQISLDDQATYELLSKGEALGVFQLESAGMRDLLRKLQPERIEDLIALLALYRPGPIGSGMVEDFIKRKHNPSQQIRYDHPLLEPMLAETYGIILYQEQVMKITNVLAGYSLSEADLLRRAMSKKNPEVFEAQRKAFVEGCAANDIEKRTSNRVFDLIEYFAGYGFNKSHSTAYALISYRTAYLKANYPTEFMTALLSSEADNTDKIVVYISEAGRMGIEVLSPSVNESFSNFRMVDTNKIRFGLQAIKNVGHTAIESIVHAREEKGPFKTLFDFCERVDLRTVNRKVSESLIKSGAMDCFSLHRSQLMAALDKALELAGDLQKDRMKGQLSFFDQEVSSGDFKSSFYEIPSIPEWPEHQILHFEKQLLGFYISGHPLARYSSLFQKYATHDYAGLFNAKDNEDVAVAGIIVKAKHTVTKAKNEKMAIVALEDLEGTVEVLVFPKTYLKCANHIRPNAVILVVGRVSLKEEEPKILANDIIPIDEVPRQCTSRVCLDLITTGLDETSFNSLKEILSRHKGSIPVLLQLMRPDKRRFMMQVEENFFIEPSEEAFKDLERFVGEENIHIEPIVLKSNNF